MPSKPVSLHVVVLSALALAVRLLYCFTAVNGIGFQSFWGASPDSRLYWNTAELLTAGQTPGHCILLWIGPGYVSIIAGVQSIFGPNPWWAILLNVIFGALTPMFVYLIAYQLTNSRTPAFIAGLLSALSGTAVTLSCNILADQPSVTFFAAGLATYLYGLRTGRARWFVAAGCLVAASALIRSANQYWAWFFLIFPLLIPLSPAFTTRLRMWRNAVLMPAIMLMVIFGWSTYNYSESGDFVFATSGALVARSALVAQATAMNVPGTSIAQLRVQWEEEDGHLSDSCTQEYGKARTRIMTMLREHPSWLLRAYLDNVVQNVKAPNALMQDQLLPWQTAVLALNGAVEDWLGFALMGVTLLGAALLMIDRNRTAWILLGAVYLFATAMVGFSFWQGSRLHYPAETAWAILVAYVVYRVCLGIKDSIFKGRKRTLAPDKAN